MKFNIKKSPEFSVGFDKSFNVKDYGKVNVDHTDKEFELLTFSNKKRLRFWNNKLGLLCDPIN